jgi:hypothetical protein
MIGRMAGQSPALPLRIILIMPLATENEKKRGDDTILDTFQEPCNNSIQKNNPRISAQGN